MICEDMPRIRQEITRILNEQSKTNLRDQLAMSALNAFISELGFVDPNGIALGCSGYQQHALIPQYEKLARFSYEMADTMLSIRGGIND